MFLNVCIAVGIVGGYAYGAIYWTPWLGVASGAIVGIIAGLLFRPNEKKDTNGEEK